MRGITGPGQPKQHAGNPGPPVLQATACDSQCCQEEWQSDEAGSPGLSGLHPAGRLGIGRQYPKRFARLSSLAAQHAWPSQAGAGASPRPQSDSLLKDGCCLTLPALHLPCVACMHNCHSAGCIAVHLAAKSCLCHCDRANAVERDSRQHTVDHVTGQPGRLEQLGRFGRLGRFVQLGRLGQQQLWQRLLVLRQDPQPGHQHLPAFHTGIRFACCSARLPALLPR